MAGILKPLQMAQLLISRHIQQGDLVVDATMGNGHDTVFLAKHVGDKGLVIGFDVQQIAVERTTERLKESEIEHCELYCRGHECMEQTFKEFEYREPSVVMFNLGYLPSADKSLISQTKTTLEAIEQSLNLLSTGGLITVVCYPGHEGGEEESTSVREYLADLDRKSWRVVEYGFINAPNNPAFLIVAERLLK